MQSKEVGLSHCSSRKMAPSSRGETPKELMGSRFSPSTAGQGRWLRRPWDKDHIGSDFFPFLSGEPPLQKEEMVKCPCASLDSASSGCHHLDWPSGLGRFRDRSQGYDQESSRVLGVTQMAFNSEWQCVKAIYGWEPGRVLVLPSPGMAPCS